MNKTVLIALVVAVFCATFSAAEPEKQVVFLKSLGVSEPKACNVASCDRSCRGLGWQGGVCMGGSCYCWKYTYAAPVPEKEHEVASLKSLGGEDNARACNAASCNNACRNRGWKGGFCSGNNCWCYK